MAWLTESQRTPQHAGDRLAQRLGSDVILAMPGVHNSLAARQCQRAGFEVAYLSGGALSASLALPDLGLLTLDELMFFGRRIRQPPAGTLCVSTREAGALFRASAVARWLAPLR